MQRGNRKAWSVQKKLKKRDIPSLDEIQSIIESIKIGKINIKEQTMRAKALFAMYYLTAGRATEILNTPKLRKRRIKKNTIIDQDGTKKVIYEVDINKKPIIETWIEEHNYLGTMKRDIKFKEYGNIRCLNIRIENRKNKNRTSKLLPIPIEFPEEKAIADYVLNYMNNLEDDMILFKIGMRRARDIIYQTTGYSLHFIRHIRATHLITLYDFNEQMLIRFMGWTDGRPAKAYMELRSSDIVKEFYKNKGVLNGNS